MPCIGEGDHIFVTIPRPSSKFILFPTVLSLLHKIAVPHKITVPPKIFIRVNRLCRSHVMPVVTHHDKRRLRAFSTKLSDNWIESHIIVCTDLTA
jgi:hypothetical protein